MTFCKPGSFLRNVIDRMGFAKNIGHGRIYRLVHYGFKSDPKPRILDESPAQLVTYLDHPNGWWRDNAQKQLIILGDRSVVPALKQIVVGKQSTLSAKPSHLGRIHALWTLEGLNAIDKDVLLAAMNDQDAQVRRASIWISEPYIKKNDAQIINKLAELNADSSYDVRTQLLLSLSYNKGDKAKSIVKDLMAQNQDNEMLVATAAALEMNENVKTYGTRLGNLAATNRNLVLQGASIFRSLCASCHGADAKGLTTEVAPPLVGSKRLGGHKNTAIKILLHGLTGPIEGKTYPGDLMPSFGANSDEWVAAVLSYARFEFGRGPRNDPKAVSPFITSAEVKTVRDESGTRTKSWTVAALEKAESLKIISQ